MCILVVLNTLSQNGALFLFISIIREKFYTSHYLQALPGYDVTASRPCRRYPDKEDILLDNSSQIYYDLSNITEEVTGDEMVKTR